MERTAMERRMLGRSLVTKQRRARGFTLVELAVVVTIVAVLSVIAMVGYRRYMLNSKITEAQSVISGIKIAQEDHKSEKGTYQDISATVYCPSGAGVSDKKYAWDSGCGNGTVTWASLAVHMEGPVQFGYATSAGINSAPKFATDVTFVSGMPTANIPNWYTVSAKCDLDSTTSTYTQVVSSSLDNRIFVNNAGE